MFRYDFHHGRHEFGRRKAEYCGQREELGHAHVPFAGDQSTEGGVSGTVAPIWTAWPVVMFGEAGGGALDLP